MSRRYAKRLTKCRRYREYCLQVLIRACSVPSPARWRKVVKTTPGLQSLAGISWQVRFLCVRSAQQQEAPAPLLRRRARYRRYLTQPRKHAPVLLRGSVRGPRAPCGTLIAGCGDSPGAKGRRRAEFLDFLISASPPDRSAVFVMVAMPSKSRVAAWNVTTGAQANRRVGESGHGGGRFRFAGPVFTFPAAAPRAVMSDLSTAPGGLAALRK